MNELVSYYYSDIFSLCYIIFHKRYAQFTNFVRLNRTIKTTLPLPLPQPSLRQLPLLRLPLLPSPDASH